MRTTELAISSDYFADSTKLEDIRELLEKISNTGFTHVHWCHEWDGDYIYSEYEMKQLREWLDEFNLKAKSLHATKGSARPECEFTGHFRKDYTSNWEYNRKAGVELIKNRIDLAKCLGAEDIVLHAYVPFVAFEKGQLTKEDFYTQVKKSLDELQPYCLERGMRICIENLFDMPEEYMTEEWDWMIENYPKEFLGFCLDAGHANMLWHERMADMIRRYGERIYAVHLHDNDGKDDYHSVPGEGTIDWKETMEALAESAYELPLTLEVVGYGQDEDEFLKKAYEKGLWLDKMYHEARA